MRLTAALNRFTQLNGDGRRFNDIQETSGFNLLTLSWTGEVLAPAPWPRFTYTFDAGGGWSADEPTEFLQNDYLHHLVGIRPVPVGRTREAAEFLGGLCANAWFGHSEPHRGDDDEPARAVWLEGFAGTGFSTSTLYHELFAQAGGSLYLAPLDTRLSVLDRAAWPYPSDAFEQVSIFSNVIQAGVSYRRQSYYLGRSGSLRDLLDTVLQARNLLPWNWPGVLHDLIGRPEVGVWLTHDTGLFLDDAGRPIDTWFGSLRIDWATGLRLETWNDVVNATDFGPTYGVQLSFDLMTFLGQ
ncbi:MAG: hypothetical protein U1E76_09360 [Planctomycetota bacterium]